MCSLVSIYGVLMHTHSITERAYALSRWSFYISHHTCSHLGVLTQSVVQRLLNPKWEVCLLHNNGVNVHLKLACVQWCACTCVCVCVRAFDIALCGLCVHRKEHNNWSKLDLAGCKGAVLWTWSYWNSMKYSMHLCLCYAQLSLLFWVLKRHNAKLELYLVFTCIVNAFFLLLYWKMVASHM